VNLARDASFRGAGTSVKLITALNRYDRHAAFFNGTAVAPDGFEFEMLEVGESSVYRDGTGRHERTLRDLEFDVAEMSMSSWMMAVARDPDLPLVGVPVFPRRFFTSGQMYANAKAGINGPADLRGRKIGLHSFQTTLSLLAKGDLKFEYGVPWEDIHWVCMRDEPIPVDFGNVHVETMPKGKDIGVMLCDGEIDAMITPQPRDSMLARPKDYRRVFTDVRSEEKRYFGKYGFYPIMHLIVVKRGLADRFPDLPRQLVKTFEDAKQLAYRYYDDSNYTLLVDARMLFEEQRATFGNDPWPNGFEANRKNIEQFIKYSQDQRLIPEAFPAERLFHSSTHKT
jgi:4,5-dihydroxyphthalate decarboxylase